MSYNFSDADQREAAMAAKWAECCEELDSLHKKLSAAQAKIDELMLEYCPDEMTKEQLVEWAKHQQIVVDTGGMMK